MGKELIELFDELESAILNDMEPDRALDILDRIRTLLNKR